MPVCPQCGTELADLKLPCPRCGAAPGGAADIARLMPDTDYVPPVDDLRRKLARGMPRTWAVTSLVMGVIAIAGCPLLGPVAIFAGVKALRTEPHARGMAILGIVLGTVPSALILWALVALVIPLAP